jgi:CheY-like chemotaxis protein
MRMSARKVAKNDGKGAAGCSVEAHRRRMLAVGEALCDKQTSDALAGWLDMEVETAENDRIATILATISLVEDRPYEAILIDVQMPDASTLAAAEWLRRHGWPGPIMACGDASTHEVRSRALESGCDGFIDKPLSSEKVKTAYAQGLQKSARTFGDVASQAQICDNDTTIPKRTARVLVVEDAICMQAIVRAFLQKMELEADMAENGRLACDMAMRSITEGRPYDVILMDIQMPKMNGKQATKWLREHQWKGPIIAVSMHSTDKDRAAFLAAGCNDCLAKPVTKDLLCSALSPYVQC